MADFWDLSASDAVGAYLTYQTAKTAAKPAADARTSSTEATGPTTDGKTGAKKPTTDGKVPDWLIYAGVGLAVGFLIFKAL